ncbi:MAG: porin [Fimbriimonadaceae bacterium]
MIYKHTFTCLTLLALAVVGATAPQEKKPQDKKETAKKAAQALSPRVKEFITLRDKATAITMKIGEIASSGKLTTSDEAVAALKALVQELADVNEKLKKMQEEIEEIKGWIEGQNESLPIIANDVDQLKRFKNGTYLQFQYTDGQNNASTARPNDGFNMRRTRFSHNGTIDAKTSYKLSVDFSSGSQRLGAELKDAQIKYDIEPSTDKVGTELYFGQQPIPLGYELERSSTEREFPERAAYNQRLMEWPASEVAAFTLSMECPKTHTSTLVYGTA